MAMLPMLVAVAMRVGGCGRFRPDAAIRYYAKELVTAGREDRPRSCPFGEHDQQRMRSLYAPRFASVCVNEYVGAKRNHYASWLP